MMDEYDIEIIKRRKMLEFIKMINNPIIEVNEDNFEKIKEANKPVLLDFWAEWCTPCRYMQPIFEKVARRYFDKMIFGRINVDSNRSLAIKYEIYAIPTLILINNGRCVERVTGLISETELVRLIEKYII